MISQVTNAKSCIDKSKTILVENKRGSTSRGLLKSVSTRLFSSSTILIFFSETVTILAIQARLV